VPDDLPNDEAIALLKQRRHRRVPVYAETPDQIVGIVDVKQFLLDPSRRYTETLIPPSFVPETMPAVELLRGFLSHPQGLAIVVDEFGGTEGIVTVGDIIEEILSDAAPLGDAELYIEPLEQARFLVSGNARLDDLTEHLGLELTADGIDTIGVYRNGQWNDALLFREDYSADQELKQPYIRQFSIGFDRVMPGEIPFGVHYIHRSWGNILEDVGVSNYKLVPVIRSPFTGEIISVYDQDLRFAEPWNYPSPALANI
jgi:CBS domain-containing protein